MLIGDCAMNNQRGTRIDRLKQRFPESPRLLFSIASIDLKELPGVPHLRCGFSQDEGFVIHSHIHVELGQLLNRLIP